MDQNIALLVGAAVVTVVFAVWIVLRA